MHRFFLFSLLVVVTSCTACSRDGNRSSQSTSPADHTDPIQLDPEAHLAISMSVDGRFANGYPWDLCVNADGEGLLLISSPDNARVEFQVSEEQMAELHEALLYENFFELGDSYGQHVPDGNTRLITITAGEHTKSVKLLFLGNTGSQDSNLLQDAQRVVRLWQLIRGWVEHPQAVNFGPYDEQFLTQTSTANETEAHIIALASEFLSSKNLEWGTPLEVRWQDEHDRYLLIYLTPNEEKDAGGRPRRIRLARWNGSTNATTLRPASPHRPDEPSAISCVLMYTR